MFIKRINIAIILNAILSISSNIFAQDCPTTINFTPSSQINTINWKQFPTFSLPFTVIYSGPRFGDAESLPLKYGFSHLNIFSGNEPNTLPLKNRAILWYNVATIAGQPWNELYSPWNNNLTLYKQKWKDDLANLANNFSDSKGQAFPKTDILLPDIERQIEFDPAIRALKSNASIPDAYKKLDDVTFTERYKRDLQKIYTEPFNYLKTIGLPSTTRIGSYGDSPVTSTGSVLNYDWKDWQNSISVLNPLFKDTLSAKLGGSFNENLTTIFPSAYFCIESKDDGRNLAYLLFQIEANRAWTNKDIILFEWLKYNRCQPTTNYNFRTFIKPSMAEAQAIFPFFAGAKGIWLWDDPSTFSGDNYNLYEYFIKGLYRLSTFKEVFTGNYQIVIPKSAHAHFLDQDPIWRGIVNGTKILIAAQNPYAKDGVITSLKVSYGTFSKTITLTGTEVFLCLYDVPLATTNQPNTDILLYPNPSDGVITLQNIASNAQISVVDLLGRAVNFEETIDNDTRKIKLINLSSGSYVLNIFSKDSKQTYRLILK